MPKPNLSKKFIFGFLLLAILLGGIPLVLSQSQIQQILSGKAWNTTQSASADCGPSGTAIINVRFTNQEPSQSMIVTAVDNQSGKSVNLGTIQAQKTQVGNIDTLKKSLNSSVVTFNMAWANNPSSTDQNTAGYSAVSTCTAPTPTITPKPTPTNTPTPMPSNKPTPTMTPKPTPTNTPTPTPTKIPTPTNPQATISPTVCPSPGTVKNVHIQCPYCTPSPSPNQ